MPKQGSVVFFSAAITTATDTTLVTVAAGTKFRLTSLLIGNTDSITTNLVTLKAGSTIKWGSTVSTTGPVYLSDNENGFFEGADGEDFVCTTASGSTTLYVSGTVEILS